MSSNSRLVVAGEEDVVPRQREALDARATHAQVTADSDRCTAGRRRRRGACARAEQPGGQSAAASALTTTASASIRSPLASSTPLARPSLASDLPAPPRRSGRRRPELARQLRQRLRQPVHAALDEPDAVLLDMRDQHQRGRRRRRARSRNRWRSGRTAGAAADRGSARRARATASRTARCAHRSAKPAQARARDQPEQARAAAADEGALPACRRCAAPRAQKPR